jgi:hypothetical protein
MEISPFLPGLILALAAWILPPALRMFPEGFLTRLAEWAPWLPAWAPWIRSVGLAYAGLIAGWISTRDYGLTGHTPAEWFLGAAAAVALGILLGRASVRVSIGLGWGIVGDEARWTLYRAAAWPWIGLPAAVAAALAAAAAEFAWGRKSTGGKLFDEVGIVFLVHAAGSALLFLLAHNFFLAMLFYAAAAVAAAPDLLKQFTGAIEKVRKPK